MLKKNNYIFKPEGIFDVHTGGLTPLELNLMEVA